MTVPKTTETRCKDAREEEEEEEEEVEEEEISNLAVF